MKFAKYRRFENLKGNRDELEKETIFNQVIGSDVQPSVNGGLFYDLNLADGESLE